MPEIVETSRAWLSDEEISAARDRLPIVYVDAVPVRTTDVGDIVAVGLLLRGMPDGSVSRAVVSGRVLYGERIRDALMRHVEKDLGVMALPQVPASPQPFTIVEYFPDPHVSGFHDPRQHAVSLAYVVPVEGECHASGPALDLVWVSPDEAASSAVQSELSGGHGRLVRMALAHCAALR